MRAPSIDARLAAGNELYKLVWPVFYGSRNGCGRTSAHAGSDGPLGSAAEFLPAGLPWMGFHRMQTRTRLAAGAEPKGRSPRGLVARPVLGLAAGLALAGLTSCTGVQPCVVSGCVRLQAQFEDSLPGAVPAATPSPTPPGDHFV